ncbi:MAG TPA: hypothetical protein VLB79_07595, partial [Solirubrobacterales bacterium]|nr:hypothetical protein [Solirubrobacterales bacterium]
QVEEIRGGIASPRSLHPDRGGAQERVETSVDLAGVYSFEDDKIRRAHIFTDRKAALEAAGVPDSQAPAG